MQLSFALRTLFLNDCALGQEQRASLLGTMGQELKFDDNNQKKFFMSTGIFLPLNLSL